uniref:YnbE-like lipoprotein n=1 Tax=Candidatus Kentrum sp. SD TaxID=2126332 RepID=A0A451BND0_9GAMM|nr:MAG: YnbE-like lipoprotein [Candidatus Kentron sp. SD]VFK48220.1 MAG: YnbE-like lipoprotein [Candidatus Kentron sp. SD]VFK79819.1 MAG: YnbE-like lipoprotein [Candidatus Kentron sp. SD]
MFMHRKNEDPGEPSRVPGIHPLSIRARSADMFTISRLARRGRMVSYLEIILLALILPWQGGCAPTVKVEAPEAPITINLNVKIEHEIRIKLDQELDELFSEESDIF